METFPGKSDRHRGVNFLEADVYMGHFSYGFKDYLRLHGMKRNCWEFTVFRNPLERAVSALYFHYSRIGPIKKDLRQDFGSQGLEKEFEVMLSHHGKGWYSDTHNWTSPVEYNNMATRMIGTDGFTSTFNNDFKEMWGPPPLVRAKDVVRQDLDGVGFMENLQALLKQWEAILGLQSTEESSAPPKGLQRPHPSFLTSSSLLQERVREWNKADVELYNVAMDKWWPSATCVDQGMQQKAKPGPLV
jgi:hypothetical protein